MTEFPDETDRRILRLLQKDASLSVDNIAESAGLSRNACWRRIKRMEESGVIRARVALVDPAAIGLGLTVLVMIRTNAHEPDWLRRFDEAVRMMPEIDDADDDPRHPPPDRPPLCPVILGAGVGRVQ